MTITLEAIRAAGGIVHSDGNIFFRDISMMQGLAGAAPAAVAGPAKELAELELLNKLIKLGGEASYALAQSNSDDGRAGAEADDRWRKLRSEMGELIRAHKAPALEAPAAPTLSIGPKLARILGYREHYRTWGRQLSDATELVESHPSHWRIVGEAMDELAAALAAAPQATAQEAPAAPAVPLKATPEMRAAFRRAYREGGFWDDRLDYALDQMLAAAPQAPAAPVLVGDGQADAYLADPGRLETLARSHPAGLVRALARAAMAAPAAPAEGEVLVEVIGLTGSGKSAICGEIEILCRALGLDVSWPDGDPEKNMTHAEWTAAIEAYKPRVRIVERNVPRQSNGGPAK
ncbi:hypothetical protein [Delftia tsuruhatensis]|uniref:hypothetical protein n=1 Tax=Delftia tsuruhatensis TaxID=180282 RepID=UPI003A8C7AA2